MATSTNQVRQFYVATSAATVNKDAAIGAAEVVANNGKVYLKHMGAGGQTRSDLIDIKNVSYLKKSEADDLARKLVRTKVILDPAVNSGDPISGQEYLLRLTFRNYIAPGEAHQMVKHGLVHGYAGLSKSDFYKTMVKSLVKNFSRSEQGILNFFLETGGTQADAEGTAIPVNKDTDFSTLGGTYTGIIIDEAPQDWILGKMSQVPVNYSVHPTTVVDPADDFEKIWGVSTKVDSVNSIDNGKKIADLEWFLMGERADQYRGAGYPHNLETTYLVDPAKKYDVIDLHYAYQGPSEDVEKSQKDITIVIPSDASGVADTLFNALNDAINPESLTAADVQDIIDAQ